MKIFVCIKQVPDTTEIKFDPKTGTMMREGVPAIMNPDDKCAIEYALELKDADSSTEVIALTMGPLQAEEALREALAMGCDAAYHICDRRFGGSDTWSTSNVLAAAIKHIGGYDLILCGRQAIDGDTAQTGPQLAEKLGLPQITYAAGIKIENGQATVKRLLEDGYMTLEASLPCVITVTHSLNAPRYMRPEGIFKAYGMEITKLTNDELMIPEELFGLQSSPTKVKRTFTPDAKAGGVMLEGSGRAAVADLVERLCAAHVIVRKERANG